MTTRAGCGTTVGMWIARVVVLAIVLVGCGASDPGGTARVSAPFTERHGQLFDDSVDMVENPQDLSGAWLEDWEKDLDERFAASDVIVRGRLVTLRTDQDLEQRTTFHLVLDVEEVLQGKLAGDEVSLRVAQDAAGYANVERYRDQMLDRPFLAFLRYYAGEAGAVEAHFHLSTPSKHLEQRLERLIAKSRPSTVRIIEHTN
jgi:hypothetical protein